MGQLFKSTQGLIARRKPEGMVHAAKAMRKNMTNAEALLWRHLRANRLGGLLFRRQQVIDRFIVDFYCHGAKLAVEIDGGSHAGRELVDEERTLRLLDYGITVLRFQNEDVERHLKFVLHTIAECAQAAIKSPPL